MRRGEAVNIFAALLIVTVLPRGRESRGRRAVVHITCRRQCNECTVGSHDKFCLSSYARHGTYSRHQKLEYENGALLVTNGVHMGKSFLASKPGPFPSPLCNGALPQHSYHVPSRDLV